MEQQILKKIGVTWVALSCFACGQGANRFEGEDFPARSPASRVQEQSKPTTSAKPEKVEKAEKPEKRVVAENAVAPEKAEHRAASEKAMTSEKVDKVLASEERVTPEKQQKPEKVEKPETKISDASIPSRRDSHPRSVVKSLPQKTLAQQGHKFRSHQNFHTASKKKGLQSFVVNDSGLSLSVISTMVYGTCKRWPQIAKLNHLRAPYRIRLGQHLVLETSVAVSKREMEGRLLSLWRVQMAKRSPGYSHAVAKLSPHHMESGNLNFKGAAPEKISVLLRAPASHKASEMSRTVNTQPRTKVVSQAMPKATQPSPALTEDLH